jgi:ElaA protein
MTPTVAEAVTEADRAACLALRRAVFVEEQGVPEHDEMDGRDDAATHLLARAEGRPVGTLRIRWLADTAKLERVCVLADHRGAGIGTALTRAALERAIAAPGVTGARLGAQLPVIGFYERLGFAAQGETYLDAGIPHRDMVRPLPAH